MDTKNFNINHSDSGSLARGRTGRMTKRYQCVLVQPLRDSEMCDVKR